MSGGGRRPGAFLAGAALIAVGVLAMIGGARRPGGPVARRHVVEMRGMAFSPAALEVRRGDTIVWINRDIVPHTATSSRTAGWDTGPLPQGISGRYVARRAGEARYFCRLHPVMLGRLIVR